MAPYLTKEERLELLAIARRAAASYVKEGKVPKERPESQKLAEPGAAFVTLTREGRLRGCIGYTEATGPLYRTVQECAVAAATEDPRFSPVRPGEVEDIRIEISVLTPLIPVRAEEVAVGVHGLLVRKGARRGLLLPQVASEYGWDRKEFLSHTCRKAGLPADEWEKGAELFSFTAEVFGE
ncbi:MAG: AmmeMemoRadiSam system protein A [Deltaproteobacteria bacterium]|nr:AmmeMemoRadiSam system protein A [Deltaproteobacteria bacterium]